MLSVVVFSQSVDSIVRVKEAQDENKRTVTIENKTMIFTLPLMILFFIVVRYKARAVSILRDLYTLHDSFLYCLIP